jgi:cytochrome P450 family 6
LRPVKINIFFIEFSDDDLVAQATVFFLAGFETSSTVLSFTLMELAANPDVQRKAQLEIDEALGQNDGEITYESLRNMKYLDWVLQGKQQNIFFEIASTHICNFIEAMRKYPPVAIHNRECTKTYKVPGTNVTIEKGFMVMIPNHALQNDSKYFPNPERFDPERFSDDDALHKYQYIYSPFGEGPRQCIGKNYRKILGFLK